MELGATGDYRAILREEFAYRCKRNSRYSLRAFARDIDLSPSRLSEVMSGRHGLSRASAVKVSRKLGYSADERDYFCDLVESVHGRSDARKKMASLRLIRHDRNPKLEQLKLDTYKLIADWYHLAIVELTKIDGFRSEPAWIAKALGISEAEANSAVERLLRLGLLEKQGATLKGGAHQTPSGIPSKAIRKAHQQILEKASEALDMQSPDERIFSTTLMCVPRDAVQRMGEKIDAFRDDYIADMQKSDRKEALYCLAVQYFRLAGDGPEPLE